jgi:small-conductance mechanosensitive channel
MAIDKAFREAGIEIAFPQSDLHIRSVDPTVYEVLQPRSGS